MRAAASVRRVTLVMTIGFLSASTAMLVSACGTPPPRHSDASAALAAALAEVLRDHPGRLAVGVIDQTTGIAATYHPDWPFDTASIIKADILAVLLLQHQQIGATLTAAERELATAMIENSENTAATTLWDAVEAGPGVEAGNAALGLRHTWPSLTRAWGLTTTTVTDQLKLLTDLTAARSPLKSAARDYELTLMRHVQPGQQWGITAAASHDTHPAVKNGWLPGRPRGQWVINSIGVIAHAGHQLLIAILSDGQPTQNAGIAQIETAARAAASAITGTP
jgi:beta-lactamase class A